MDCQTAVKVIIVMEMAASLTPTGEDSRLRTMEGYGATVFGKCRPAHRKALKVHEAIMKRHYDVYSIPGAVKWRT